MFPSSYFSMKPLGGGDQVMNLGAFIYRGQVIKVNYADETSNRSKVYTEYDVVIEMMNGGVSTFKNVPRLHSLGGYNDLEEEILEPVEVALKGKNDTSNTFENKNGTIVAVAFLNGNLERPVIVGCFNHPKKAKSSKASGISQVRVFRGVKTEINKDGEWSITYQSPYAADGKLKAEATGPTYIKIDKNGAMIMSIKKDTIKQTHDGVAEKTTFQYKSGLKVEYDGKGDKVVYTTKGGTTVEIDGAKKITLTAGASVITIDGNSGKISLSGNLVDVGTGAAALAVLGPQLIAWLASHTHLGDGPSIPPAPTSPPLVPPPASLLSQTVKIKA